MKSYSNTYIFVFSTIMVVVVAAVLSFTAMQLQPLQKKNVEINKKQNILSSLNLESTADNAEELYDKYIEESYVLNTKGERNEGLDAFSVDMKKELAKEEKNRNLPMFVSHIDGQNQYIIPVRGKGLWGPIWGYVALKEDMTTVYGTNFSHKSETPGLGAEIDTKNFQDQFIGKKIFNEEGEFVSVAVLKGGAADPDSSYEVDGISGGTITSKGVDAMLEDCLNSYTTYFKKNKKE